jgi:thiamine biosynthesis lipoprotein
VITGRAMGCDWKLVTDEAVAAEQLRGEIGAVLEHWEQVLSTWRPDSDLSRHNRGEPATADLSRVLRLAEQLHAESGGAFDHRMLASLTAAGFGPGGSGIDLSSLGKGFAVDRVAELLRERGIRRHVFSLAGEVRAGDGEWPVGIETPDGGIAETLRLSNQSMATSGNYRQGRPVGEGRVAGHILDPASGLPVTRPPCGVTVIAADAATASGWATALFVRGPRASPPPGLRVIWHGRAE